MRLNEREIVKQKTIGYDVENTLNMCKGRKQLKNVSSSGSRIYSTMKQLFV